MNVQGVLIATGLGVGAVYLFSKLSGAGVAAPLALDDVAACRRMKPNWTDGVCTDRLADLKAAFNGAKAQLGVITAARAAYVQAGNTAQVIAIDKAAAPWQTAIQQHAQDYWNLTGRVLA